MLQINTLIKPTHQCNMRCRDCFAEKYGYDNSILDMSSLKKYIELLSKKYNYINLVWHGGEPLMVPLEYYDEIYSFCKNIDSKIIYSLQTNGTLLNQENIDFFKKNNTSIGLSFDGLNNDKTRANTKKILSNIELLQSNEMFPGAVLVVNQYNIDNLVEEYEYFKSLKLGMKINPMFSDGAAKNSNFCTLNPEQYIENFVTFFKYWALDTECDINVSTCLDLVNLIVNNHTGVCTFNSCLGKWICFDSNGHVYPCDRLCLREYDLGDIKEMKDIDEVFQNSNFVSLIQKSISRRQECINSCDYYENCYGGCNANAILGEINHNNVSCFIQKGILKEIKNFIIELIKSNNTKNLNPSFEKILIKKENV